MRRLLSLSIRQTDLTDLSALHRDPKARSIYAQLFLHASQPYVHMLVKWVSTGHLSDKHEEFLVKETTSISKQQLDLDFTDEYWERRYTVGPALRCFFARSALTHFPVVLLEASRRIDHCSAFPEPGDKDGERHPRSSSRDRRHTRLASARRSMHPKVPRAVETQDLAGWKVS